MGGNDSNSDSNISNSTSDACNNTIPASQCIPWIAVLIAESLLIVIVNLVTVIVFATQHQLQRRGTYVLIRNLAIIDLLVGIVSGPLQIERIGGQYCALWKYDASNLWAFLLKQTFLHLFSFASLGNLVAISLERMHAIVYPSKHLFMKKWVYKVIIAVIWLTAIIREIVQIAFLKTQIDIMDDRKVNMLTNSTLYLPYYLISLLIISVTYISIFIKIRCSPQPHPLNSSVIVKERQLTVTLFVVTIASLFSLLPVIFLVSSDSFTYEPLFDRCSHIYVHIRMVVIMFFLANSLVNPIVYSMRIQGFRAGLTEVFRGRDTNHVHAAHLLLREL